jgi:pimeloyl-ACP methyl ester carboxylesterase
MPETTINELCINYEEAGAGSAILLLHGLGSRGQDWLLQMPVFAARFHVIAPDLHGHGQTAPRKPRGHICIAQMTRDVIGLLDALDVPRAHVVGLSLGGCMAQQLALDFPARVRSLTLINTFARFDPGSPGNAIPLAFRMGILGVLGLPAQAHFVAARLFPKPEQAKLRALAAERIAANDMATYTRLILAIRAFDVTHRLSEIACPTLVIAGDRDTTVPLRAKQFLASHIPGARFELITDSGHATPVDQPEAFNQLVMDFIESVS